MSGGDKSKVKIAPFGTKTPAISDYAHIKDMSTKTFAVVLGKDKKDPRDMGRTGRVGEEEEEENMEDDDGGSPSNKKKPKGKKQTAVDPDDLRAFLQEEGIDPDGENLCPLPKCMDNISKIILNDKNSKVEKAEILLEIEELNRQLQDSMKEEETATATLQALNKEQAGLENTVESQKEKAKALEQKREDLENEKKTFNGRMSVLEKDQRNWAAKLKVAQQKFAKVIWLKPGQKYDDNDGHMTFDIQHIRETTKRDLDEISLPATVGYDRSAGAYVRDYNERIKGPLYYSNYVDDSIDRDNDLLSAATTSRLAFFEKKKAVRRLVKSSRGGPGNDTSGSGSRNGASGEVETKKGRASPITIEDSATVVSHLTMDDEYTAPGEASSPHRSTTAPRFRREKAVNAGVKSVHEYLTSGAARAMTRSPDKNKNRVGGGGGYTSNGCLDSLGAESGGGHRSGLRGLPTSSQSVGGGGGGAISLSSGSWKDPQKDLAVYNRSALVTSSMSRSGNKNPASVMGSPVKALQALKAAKEEMKRENAMKSQQHQQKRGGSEDDARSIATMSTLANDTNIFEIGGDASQWVAGDNGSFASIDTPTWEGGGAVGGSIITHNTKYGRYHDKGKVRTVTDGVGTLNYKPRTLKDMLEADEFE